MCTNFVVSLFILANDLDGDDNNGVSYNLINIFFRNLFLCDALR